MAEWVIQVEKTSKEILTFFCMADTVEEVRESFFRQELDPACDYTVVDIQPRKYEYEVKLCRVSYGFASCKIMATSELEAEKLALERAGDLCYSEKDADYSVQEVTR